MLKFEFLKCMDLRNKISQKVKGKIFVTKNDDILTIYISPYPRISYRINVDNDLIKGDLDKIADEIYHEYKKYLLSRFFYI